VQNEWYLSSHAWRTHLLDEVLAHWLAHAPDRQYGGYLTEFDRLWNPNGTGVKTLVSQSRLLYNFSCGYRYTQDARYRQAAELGLAFLREHFADRQQGGWFWQCRRDGHVDDDRKDAYGHAFVIFGLAQYARAFRSPDAAALARQTLAVLQEKMSVAGAPGFWRRATRNWQPDTSHLSQNPHMHLLEAVLSLHVVSDDNDVLASARALCRLAEHRFIHPQCGCLEEFFGPGWSVLSDAQAAPVETGHQFEWAWLLHRMADRTRDDAYRDLAGRLMAWGVRHGWDRQHGGIFNQCDRRGRPVRTDKTYWVQCEAFRALLYQALRDPAQPRDPLAGTARFVWEHAMDHTHGGWFASVNRSGTPVNSDKGGPWKLDYHVVSLCDEALRLLAAPNHSAREIT
jgi:mannose/cellobiose epimerase-like protein (N-acyl-D-glucosamine 2-epimerase family)